MARNAGSRETAISISTKTTIAAEMPRLAMSGMPIESSPSSAAATITPAKATARPAVPTAVRTA